MTAQQITMGTFSRKSGFTIVKLSYERKRDLKYIGKSVNTKQEYDEMSIEQVMSEIAEDLKIEFDREVTLELTTSRSGRIYCAAQERTCCQNC